MATMHFNLGDKVVFTDRKGTRRTGLVTIVSPEGNICPYLEVESEGKKYFVDDSNFVEVASDDV